MGAGGRGWTAAVLLLLVLLVVACRTSPDVALARAGLSAGCVRNSSCADPLVCVFARCHVQCASDRDCAGHRCLAAAPVARGVCQQDDEVACARNVDCPGTELCGPDGRCVDACASDRDCRDDAVCVAGACTARGPGGAGDARPAGASCRHASDCAADLVCLYGRCNDECVGDRDCIVGWSCRETRCHPPTRAAVPLATCADVGGAAYGSALAFSGEDYLRCALRPDGALFCWGDANVGDGSTLSAASPRRVLLPGGTRVVSVSANGDMEAADSGPDDHACAATSAGDVYCWGLDTRAPGVVDRPVPVKIDGLPPVQQVAADVISDCALAGTDVYCWGQNAGGVAGLAATPIRVDAVSGHAIAIAGGYTFACALRDDAKVVCWGDLPVQLGGDGGNSLPKVVQDFGGEGAVALGVSAEHACVLLGTGAVACWGQNSEGELGDGTRDARSTPTRVGAPAGARYTGVAVGYLGTCAVRSDGALVCWGKDLRTLSGFDAVPTPIDGLPGPVAYAAIGARIACARLATGPVYCFGARIGDGTSNLVATPMLLPLPCD